MNPREVMRAAVLHNYGEPVRVVDVPFPELESGHVLVRIRASGVNSLDTKIRINAAAHTRTTLPAILGIDLAGVVEAVAADVDGFAPGDEVYGMTGGVGGVQGSLAQYAAVDAQLIALKPKSWTFREAAAVPLAAVVALGAAVFATGTATDAAAICTYGATAIDFTSTSPEDYVIEHTGGVGFDVIFDTVGGATLDASLASVRRYTGHVVSILGWGTHSLAPLSFRGATYSGVFSLLPLLTGQHRGHHGAILHQISILADAGGLTLNVDPSRYTLETVPDAHQALETRSNTGKIVIDIG